MSGTPNPIFALLAGLLLLGCEPSEPSAPGVAEEAIEPTTQPSPWRTVDGWAQIALPAGEGDPEMEAAMAEARRTAAEARRRWYHAPAGQRANWYVKWAAPTAASVSGSLDGSKTGGAEYVWVQPASWSAFRIEGRLASPPQSALACGKQRDEVVSFPAEQLADWLYLAEGRMNGRREGGFTVDLLEGRFGAAAAGGEEKAREPG